MQRKPWLIFLVIVSLFSHVLPLRGKAALAGGLKRRANHSLQAENGLTVLRSDKNGVVLRLDTNRFFLEPNQSLPGYTSLRAPELENAGMAGAPALPQKQVMLGVPPDARVSIKILGGRVRNLSGEYRLAPAPSPARLENDLTPGEWVMLPDEQLYQQDTPYPAEPVRLGTDGWIRDQRFVSVLLSPFQYQPHSGKITLHSSLTVEVRFSGQDKDKWALPADGKPLPEPFEAGLQTALLNYQQASAWRATPLARAATRSEGMDAAGKTLAALAGPRYRIEITQDGIYRLSYAALQNAGLDVANIDPTLIQMTNQGDEIAITIQENDADPHTFSPGEALVFYGEAFHGERMAARFAAESQMWRLYSSQTITGAYTTWQPQFNAAMVEKYTDVNVYWLQVGPAPGKRMPVLDGTPGSAPVPASFRATVREEQSHYWKTTLFTGEDTWYWDLFQVSAAAPTVTQTYTITVPFPAAGTYTATLVGEAVGAINNPTLSPDHHSKVYINASMEPDPQPVVDQTWDGISRFQFKAEIPQSQLADGQNELTYMALKSPVLYASSQYFNWFSLSYERQFKAVANQLAFSGDTGGTWKYQVSGFTGPEIIVFDVTQPLTTTLVSGGTYASGQVTFQVNHSIGEKFFAGAPQDLDGSQIKAYSPPDLNQQADYIIISPADFMASAQRLADYRASKGYTTRVVDIQDLYNQFTAGIFHPIAIKEFLAYAFATWSAPPTYVVLVGDGHWNFKGYPDYNSPPIYMPPNLSWVDPWQGEVDSANLLATVVGDDPLPDVYIARIPVNSNTELNAVIDKIINYEASPLTDWQRRVLFVADNVPDPAGDFVALSESIISDYLPPGFAADRIYENAYGCSSYPCPQVNNAITRTLSVTGTLLANYTGHASVDRWAHEKVFVNSDIPTLANGDRLPVLLSMTCLDGYWLHPGQTPNPWPSLVEELLRTPEKGAVSTFSPTGLGVSTGHDSLQRGFYETLFQQGVWQLGPATQAAKTRLYQVGGNLDLLHTFTIFGDPALEILSPYGVDLSPETDSAASYPGGVVTYTLQITNSALVSDTLIATVNGNQWPTQLAASIGPLAPGASTSLMVEVAIPAGAQDGALDVASVSIFSHEDERVSASAVLSTTASAYQMAFEPAGWTTVAEPGSQAIYTLRLTNTGALADGYALSLSGVIWPAVVAPINVDRLLPGEGALVSVSVQVPASADKMQSDSILLTATSGADPGITQSVELTTTAGFALYLPALNR